MQFLSTQTGLSSSDFTVTWSGKVVTIHKSDWDNIAAPAAFLPDGVTVFSFTSTTSAPVVTDDNISISGANGTSGEYIVGDTVTATWDDTLATGDANPDTQSVTFDFSQFGGPAAVPGTNNSGIWTASHNIEGSIVLTNRNVSVTATDDDAPMPLSTTTADTTNAVVDTVAPTVTLTGPAENVTSVFDVQISFDDPVTGFAIGDVTVTNGTVTALSGAGASYTATVDPVPGTIIQISVLANVAFDISGNGNTASNVLNIQFATPRTLLEEYREKINPD